MTDRDDDLVAELRVLRPPPPPPVSEMWTAIVRELPASRPHVSARGWWLAAGLAASVAAIVGTTSRSSLPRPHGLPASLTAASAALERQLTSQWPALPGATRRAMRVDLAVMRAALREMTAFAAASQDVEAVSMLERLQQQHLEWLEHRLADLAAAEQIKTRKDAL